MKRIAITTAAVMSFLAGPVFAGETTTTSRSASGSEAIAVSGGPTTIFEATRLLNNTPNTYAQATQGTTHCQYPGLGAGAGQPGFGLNFSIPLGTDTDCEHERMAAFRMRTAELLLRVNPAESQRNIAAANESLCRISYNAGTAMCAPAPTPQPVTVYYWCHSPAGYYPAVQGCARWETVAPR